MSELEIVFEDKTKVKCESCEILKEFDYEVPMYLEKHLKHYKECKYNSNEFQVIGTICFESNPCHHSVCIGHKTGVMNGKAIAYEFLKRNQEVPFHFQQYLFDIYWPCASNNRVKPIDKCDDPSKCVHLVELNGVRQTMTYQQIRDQCKTIGKRLFPHFS